MKNIIKSIVYEILHSKLLLRMYLLFLGLYVFVAIINIDTGEGAGKTSGMLADGGALVYEIPIFVLALVVGVICGEDYKDKVANYEVLSGHSRKRIFLARSLFAIIAASVSCLVISFIPLIAGNIYAGWGNKLVLGDVVSRYLLLIFPYMRLAAFLVVITFVVKNHYAMMAIGFFIMEASIVMAELTNKANVYISIYNMKMLTSFDSWNIYNTDPVEGIIEYSSYNSSLNSEMVIGTIVVSLALTAFYLFLGYALFRRDELS
ncbi:MAG: hypothetical protein IKS48_04865 [Eubacterium sp.]|nr:hypothetical protein [Eubacterium sp.]